VKAQAQAATAEVRRVVYALRPPALDELGLVPALREQAAQYSQNGLRVTVEAPEPLPPLPAAVEVAAYRIGVEALTNVVRHARARTCTVCLTVGDDLQLEIADDGHGFDVARELRRMPAMARCTLVALTGYSQPADRERARLAGFDHYLVKPVEIDKRQSMRNSGSGS